MCTRCFETQSSPGCTCTRRSKFLTHSLSTKVLKASLCLNSGKSDALRLKKCVKVLTSFKHEGEAKLIELTAYFQDNVPQNETTFVYTNENKIVVDLRKGDIHK